MNFIDQVIISIYANNKYGIIKLSGLESLKSICFVKEEFIEMEKLIKKGNIERIKMFPENQPNTGEYLDVMEFKDQNQHRFIVTVYDNNMLEQDTQVIEIYPLKHFTTL